MEHDCLSLFNLEQGQSSEVLKRQFELSNFAAELEAGHPKYVVLQDVSMHFSCPEA
jgi:hypothetical protein